MLAFLIGAQHTLAAEAPDASPAADATPITEYRLPPDKLEKSQALYRTGVTMNLFATVYGIALLVVLLSLRVSARIRDFAERVSKRRFVQVIIFAPLLLILIDILTLPLSIYGHDLQMSYGLSVQGWGSWFGDWIKGELIGTVVATLFVWGLYAFLRRSPQRWWLYGWLASIPVVLLLVLIQPVFIAPLFNHFEPLEAETAAAVAGARKGDASRRAADRSCAHVRDAGERQGHHVQRLRHRHRRKQTRRRMGQHVARHDDSGNAVRVRPRTGPLRAASRLDAARLSDLGSVAFAVSGAPLRGRRTRTMGATLGHTRPRRLGFAAGHSLVAQRLFAGRVNR